jgi:thiamine phosphate synthase YjbQ (UPF0047 family)
VKSYRKELWFETPGRRAFLNITPQVVVAITAGKLDFGPWEQIFYGEFDGGRRKRVLIKIVGQ